MLLLPPSSAVGGKRNEQYEPRTPGNHMLLFWGLGGCSFDKWIKVVMDEFFHIGDLEKQAGMKVSMNQCRKSTGIDKCQQGFIVFVVKPLYEQMTRLMPGVEPAMAQLLTNVATLSKKLAA